MTDGMDICLNLMHTVQRYRDDIFVANIVSFVKKLCVLRNKKTVFLTTKDTKALQSSQRKKCRFIGVPQYNPQYDLSR